MSSDGTLDIRVCDVALRDGSHAKRHQFSTADVKLVVEALDNAGVPVIEVAHGDGLGGSSFNFGFSATDEMELITAAAETAQSAAIAVLLLPGVGVKEDLRAARDCGASIARIATHCTEADIAVQHFQLANTLGMEAVGFLMMAHRVEPDVLAAQARIMADAGCACVYVVDSAGSLILDDVTRRVEALVEVLDGDATVGFHGHQNLGLGVANSICAVRAGAGQIDASTRGFGAGSGNTPTEVLAAVCARLGINTGIDVFKILDAAEDVLPRVMDAECVLDRLSLTMGFAGVYSSFLKHAFVAAERYGVSGTELLVEAGTRGLVGGQEDQLIDIAIELASQ